MTFACRLAGFAPAKNIAYAHGAAGYSAAEAACAAKAPGKAGTHGECVVGHIKLKVFTDFLNKPISIDQLYDVIFRYVKRLDNVSHISDNGNITIKKSDQIDTISTKSHDNNIQIPVAEVNIKSKGVRALYDFVKEDTTASLEILKSFISETRESQMGFKEAFENGDVATASKISHKMLPLYRMIGNEKVVGIMEQLENNNQINEEDKRYLLDAIQNSIDEGTELERAFNKE